MISWFWAGNGQIYLKFGGQKSPPEIKWPTGRHSSLQRSKYLSKVKYLFLSPSLKVSSWKHRAPLITSEEEPRPIFPKPWERYPWKKSLTRANASLRGKTIGKAYCSPCHNTSPTLNHFQVLKQCLCPPCPFSGWNRKELHFIWSCLETAHTTCLPWRTELLFNFCP